MWRNATAVLVRAIAPPRVPPAYGHVRAGLRPPDRSFPDKEGRRTGAAHDPFQRILPPPCRERAARRARGTG